MRRIRSIYARETSSVFYTCPGEGESSWNPSRVLSRLLPFPLFIFFSFFAAYGQPNLVQNGSFENYSVCPVLLDDFTPTGWFGCGTPNYFNVCHTGSQVGVPSNARGSQNPAQGNGYAGLMAYMSGNTREYIGTSIPLLQKGGTYELSLSLSLADTFSLGCNNIGARFFKNTTVATTQHALLPYTSHLTFNNNGIVTNQSNWIRVSSEFIADSTYDMIVIGNFSNNAATTTATASGGTTAYAYYYIDSIVLRLVKKLSLTFADSALCISDSLTVPYYVVSDSFNTGNVFTLELSNAGGSFTSPVSLATVSGKTSGTFRTTLPTTLTAGGGYRLRMVSSSPADTSAISKEIRIDASIPAKPVINSNSPVCTIDTLTLSASTNMSVTWHWQGPGSFTSTSQSVVLANPATTAGGNYIVTASNGRCFAKDTAVVVINQSPIAITASSNGAICEQDTLKLFTSTSSSGVSYNWTGPNSYTAATRNPMISNASTAAAGKYHVMATATNGCFRKDSVAVTVKPKPFISAGNNGPVCEIASLNLTGIISVSGASFSWTGPNSFSSSSQSPTIVNTSLAAAGTYVVTASLNGCSDTGASTVVVNTLPSLSLSSNSPVCHQDTIKLFSTTSGITYSWIGPNSFSSSVANPLIPGASALDYGYYRLTVTGSNGCSRTDSIQVITRYLPVCTASNTGPVCEGGSFSLQVSSSFTGLSYLWSGPNSFSATSANVPINNAPVAASGTYTVTATLFGCSYTTTTTATVHPLPVAQAGAHSPVCLGGSMQLIGNSIAGATYAWTGPSFSSSLQSPSFPATSLAQGGAYILVVTANGCVSKPDTVKVKVNILSKIGGYVSPNDTICAGTMASFVAFVQDGGPAPIAQWYRNHNPVGNPNVLTYTPSTINNGDVYYCKLTAPDVCFTTLVLHTDTMKMVVLPVITKPEVTITADPGLHVRPADMVKFTANVKNGGTSPKHQWYKNGLKQTGATTATFSATGLSYMDMVHVDIISEDPCATNKNASDTVWIQFPLTVEKIQKTNIVPFPNPNTGSFVIRGASKEPLRIDIFNTLGHRVFTQISNQVSGEIPVTAELPNGTYLLRVNSENTSQAITFCILK